MLVINCPGCGMVSWLTGERNCSECDVILRRCVDCSNYSRAQDQCRRLRIEIDRGEAQRPTTLAVSTLCRDYHPVESRKAA